MKKHKAILLAALSLIMIFFSLRPFLFTWNFVMYMIENNAGRTDQAEIRLLNVIRYIPEAYRSIIHRDRSDLLVISAAVFEQPGLLAYLSDRDREKAEQKYQNNLFFARLKGKRGGRLFIEPYSRLSSFILSRKIYNRISIDALGRMTEREFSAQKSKLITFLKKARNPRLLDRVVHFPEFHLPADEVKN